MESVREDEMCQSSAIKRLFACIRLIFILSFILFSLQLADGILLDDNGAFVPTARASEDASEETSEPASDETIDAYDWYEQAGIDIPEDSGVQVVPIGETGDTAAENEQTPKKDKDAEIESSLPESSMQSMMAGGGVVLNIAARSRHRMSPCLPAPQQQPFL